MKDNLITAQDRLVLILEAMNKIEAYVKNHDRKSFLKDEMVIDATLFQFAIIGEAIQFVTSELLEKYSYPWHKVRSFRNFILHEYNAISYRIVWDTVKEDLPLLKAKVAEILQKEF